MHTIDSGEQRSMSGKVKASSLLVSALLFSGAQLSYAQDSAEEEVFELSPFEVTAENDRGYVAENTLSGTRLNTAVKDLATTMSILTEQVWQDTASTDINDMLIFTPGAEKSESQFGRGNSRQQWWGDNTMFRGVQVENIVRNQFRSNIPSDTYNASRFEISRGPNAVLFGVTREPAGLVNRTTQDATFTRSNELQVRIDDNGSYRTSLSLNQVLIEDKLAARVSLLDSNSNHWIQPGFQDQERAYFALNYTPNEKLSVKFRGEHLSWDRAAVNPSVPADRVTAWINAGKPGVDAAASDEDVEFPEGTANWTGNDIQTAFVNDGSGRMVQLRNFARGTGTRLLSGGIASLPVDFLPLDLNVGGEGGAQHFSGYNYQAIAQYRVNEKINLELAYNDEFVLYGFRPLGGSNLFVDANTTLDDGVTANPHFGDYFTLSTGGFAMDQDRFLRGIRASGSFTHDFADGDQYQWLGKHDFVLMFEQNTDEFYWDVLRLLPEGVMSNGEEGPLLGRVLTYVDPDTKSFSGPTWGYDMAEVMNSVPGNTYDWRNRLNGAGINNNRTEIDSSLLVWQSRFWNGRIVPTLGWRQDEITQWGTGPRNSPTVRLDSREVGLAADPETEGLKPSTSNQGIVFHAIENQGVFDHISLFYNQADSFSVANFGQRPDLTSMPAKTGETEDYGVRFGLFEGRVSGVFTMFDMAVANATVPTSWRPIWSDLGDLFDTIGKSEWHEVPQVNDTQDIKSEGWEFQLTANVNENWNIMFGLDHYKTFDSNVAPRTLELIDEYSSQWQGSSEEVPDRQSEANPSDPMTAGELFDVMQRKVDLQLAQVGGYKNNERQYKATFLTNYKILDGTFKGVAFGGNAIWQDKAATGFPFIDDPELGTIVDAKNPFYSSDVYNIGIHASYNRKIFGDKVDWKVQVNVNNLGDKDPFVTRHSVVADDPRTPIIDTYSRGALQTFVLTNTFKF
ncbi:hypothetical protein JIN87_03700 [Pelagicoccus mobilis]|uniref:TonB-dependent receptor plug domain-containing protein n=2 Tax=Pelagicoccus mobilis TaxID=415221 RepID=A0A934RYP4_9BACT|nr:hypothetical protein [Pelagicoccus mobilis]